VMRRSAHTLGAVRPGGCCGCGWHHRRCCMSITAQGTVARWFRLDEYAGGAASMRVASAMRNPVYLVVPMTARYTSWAVVIARMKHQPPAGALFPSPLSQRSTRRRDERSGGGRPVAVQKWRIPRARQDQN
jgi:hypothetical protein